LIDAGHPPDVAWDYTLREINGWLSLIAKRKKYERIEKLKLLTIAGDPKAAKKQVTEWERS